jgi:hypothetical protein
MEREGGRYGRGFSRKVSGGGGTGCVKSTMRLLKLTSETISHCLLA